MQPFEPQQLPINDIQWDSLIPLIGKANRSLAYYDGILYGLANPDVLLSPLTTQEAVLSSKIEGTQATLKFYGGLSQMRGMSVRRCVLLKNYWR